MIENKKFKGLATGIGSMPHKDADKALELIFKYLPDIPFWPQLPKRDFREGMINQFSENLPFLKVIGNDTQYSVFDTDEGELERFYERIINDDVSYFAISEQFACGLHKFYKRLERTSLDSISFIKCHITGPFSFAAGIRDEKGANLLHDSVFMQVVIKGLAMKARWQLDLFSKFGKDMIIFLDEPYLGGFGSAYTPINREEVVSGLSDISLGIKRNQRVLVGVHCCGNTDWSMLADVTGLDIISFDAYSFQDRFVLYADSLNAFLKKGGIICWGIIPTQEFSGNINPSLLKDRLLESLDKMAQKGIDMDLLFDRLLISPSCGMGTLEEEKAKKILDLLQKLSILLKLGKK